MSALGSAVKIAIMLAATDRATPIIGKVFNNAEKHAKHLVETQENLNKIGDQAIIAGAAITEVYKKSFEAAEEAEKANKRLESSFSIFKERGEEIAEKGKVFAEAWQFKVGINAEDIEATEAKFAPFKNMFTESAEKAKLFERATKAAYNMAAQGFGNATDNAQKLGMFLNNPIVNMNKMNRVLGGLDPKVKAHLQNLVLAKKYTEAQDYALKLVESRFGKTAEAMATESDKAKVSLHAIMVTIGQQIMPTVNKFLSMVNQNLPTIIGFIKSHSTLIKVIGGVGVGLLGLGAAFKVAAFAMNPLIWGFKIFGTAKKFLETAEIVKKLSLLKGTFLQLKEFVGIGFDAIKNGIVNSVKFIGQGLSSAASFLMTNPIILIVAAIAAAAFLIYKYWAPIKEFFIKLWNGILNNKYVQMALAVFMPIIGIPIIIIKHWDRIKSFFSDLWDAVKRIFMVWVNWTFGLPVKMFKVGVAFIENIWKGIKTKATWLWEKVKGVAQKIRNLWPFSPAKEGPLRDIHKIKLMETIAATIRPAPVLNAMRGVTNQVAGYGGHLPIHNNYGGSVVFAPVIHLHGSATQKESDMIIKKMRDEFPKLMRQYNSQQSRINFHS